MLILSANTPPIRKADEDAVPSADTTGRRLLIAHG
jgi:hypothetical protein